MRGPPDTPDTPGTPGTPGAPDTPESLLARARATTDDLEARLLLAAAAAQAGREIGARVVLTGGSAADLYVTGALGTSAAYPALWRPSGDVNVVMIAVSPWMPTRKALLDRLERMGLEPRYFTDVARVVMVPDLPFYLEIVAEELGGRERDERTMTILVDGRVPLEVRSPESLILAYGESGLHLRHSGDWTRALSVYSAMKGRLDVEWMKHEAARRGQADMIELVLAMRPSPWRPSGIGGSP